MTNPEAVRPEESPIFVIGTSRSGTTLLRMMLCAHPRIYLTHEASFYLWESNFPLKRRGAEACAEHYVRSFSFRWLRLDPRPLLRALPRPMTRADLRGLYTAVMREKAAQYGKVRFGDKTPNHSGHLARIFEDYPDARAVRIVRDPRGVVRSLGRMPWCSPSLVACALLAEAERRQTAPFRDRILEIRLEDLLSEPRATMEQVLEHVGEPWSDQVLDHTSHLPDPDDLPPMPWFQRATGQRRAPEVPWKGLAPAEVRLVERMTRKSLEDGHYPPAPLDAEPGRLAVFWRWLFDLPRVLRSMVLWVRTVGAGRDLTRRDDGAGLRLLMRLNPKAWERYPDFEMPDPPPLPEGWREALDERPG